MPNLLGWFSSLVLLLTLIQQVVTQWRSRTSNGVSLWLFAGQFLSSAGFALYSYLLGNWVFLVTNLVLLVNAGLGQWVTVRNRRITSSSGTALRGGARPQ
ncbi:MAG TPA: hypothetical protein VG963_26035 [Polyangiaceae bacterium]|nr:hypothetical protein [Polyangiaceae bacterium]